VAQAEHNSNLNQWRSWNAKGRENNMYEIQVFLSGEWVTSGNLPRKENRFATRAKAEKMMTKVRSDGMDYRVMHIGDAEPYQRFLAEMKEGNDDEFNLAQIKAILTEPSKLQRIAKLLEEN
jgi:hypothetical protein